MNTKTCTRCLEDLAIDQFVELKGKRAGQRQSICRDCDREKGRAYRAANRDRLVEYDRRRAAEQHEERLAQQRASAARHREARRAGCRAYYAENRDRINAERRAAHATNPEPNRAASRAAYAQDPERVRERVRAYRAANPEKIRDLARKGEARKKNAPVVEPISRAKIIARDGARCHICGKKVRPRDIHLDHLVPLSKGGEHTARNVAVAHAFCNMSRHDGRLPAQLLLIG